MSPGTLAHPQRRANESLPPAEKPPLAKARPGGTWGSALTSGRLSHRPSRACDRAAHARGLHNAVLLIFAGVAVLVLSVITIGAAVTGGSGAAGTVALALVLAGTVMLLGGLLLAARSIMISMDAIDYEVRRALAVGF